MAKDWDELPNKGGAMADPASGIRKFNVLTGPVGALFGALDIAGDRADYDNYYARAQCAKSFAEARFACAACFAASLRLQTINWALAQVH